MSAKRFLSSALFSSSIVLQAAPLSVPNFSFEQPAIFGAQATNWTANSGAISGGVNPFNVSGGFTAADDGDWFHFLNLPGFGGVNPSVTESNSSLIGNAAAGTYTLTVAGGHRSNGATTNGSYVIELLAGGTVIASETLINPFLNIPNDSWQDITAIGSVYPGDPSIGQDITIRLSAYEGTAGNQGQFDNVRLDYNPSPHAFSTLSREILLDNADFEVKGVCYQPTAIGEDPITPALYYGDFYYTDGDTVGIDEEFPQRWARDFANFKKMGINVVRVYQWDPNLADNSQHSAFLEEAYKHGIYLLLNRYIAPNADFADADGGTSGYQPSAQVLGYADEWTKIAQETANHPAVMGYLIGNEANNEPDPNQFYTAMNYLAGVVKGIAPNKLVSSAITDRLDQVNAYDGIVPNFDFWAMQIYRGTSFTSFLPDYQVRSSKPLIITETGHDALDGPIDTEFPNNAEIPADALESLWNELRADEIANDIAGGACFFEYSDEWWKDTAAANPSVQDYGPRWNFPGGTEGNEEWWGIFRVVDDGANIDILQPRAAFYRLASMWNDPFSMRPATTPIGGDLQMTFSYPLHLRDQNLLVEGSTDLQTWQTVADNSTTQYLDSKVATVSISSLEAGESVNVTVLHDPDATGGGSPVSLVNGSFESGTTGWAISQSGATNPITASGAYAISGSNSLLIDSLGAGEWASPNISQTFAASPGDEFNLQGYILTPSSIPDISIGILKIEFLDSGGSQIYVDPSDISTGTAAAAPYGGAESTPALSLAQNISPGPANWIFTEAQAVAPAGTVSVRFLALNVNSLGSANVFYFEDLVATTIGASGPPAGPTGPKVFFRFTNNGR